MKVYRQVSEDAEYREYYDSYRITVDNLNSTDFLYKTSLSNGQVFFENDEVYGTVNGQQAIRNTNITITSANINDFTIQDFQVYDRLTNSLINLDIHCNLNNYRDGKPHYLYIILSGGGVYEVYDDMFRSNNNRILFARFIIGTDGNSEQFYILLPFAGSADYIKGNQFYQVSEGLRLQVLNANTKQLTISTAKVKFSGINFDDEASPDCLTIDFGGYAVPIKYVKWDSTDNIIRADWESASVLSLINNKQMNYTTGSITNVSADKFTIQKLYFDIYTRTIIALYGNNSYNTMESALSSITTVMSYPIPDGIEYLIPFAAVIIKNTSSAIDNTNFKIINLDYNERDVVDSDSYTQQIAAEALLTANNAESIANTTSGNLSNHIGDRTNPHRVQLDQLYNSQGVLSPLSDDYANTNPASIASSILSTVSSTYYPITGGTITGNVEIGTSSATKNLVVYGTSNLKGNVTLGGNLYVGANGGNILGNAPFDIGSSNTRARIIYATNLDITGSSVIAAKLTSRAIEPSADNTYSLGAASKKFAHVYANSFDATGSSTLGSTSISGTLSVTGNTSMGGNLTLGSNKKINVDNGYIIIGGKALCLGRMSGLPVATGYAIDIDVV